MNPTFGGKIKRMDTKIDFGTEHMQRSIRSMIVDNLALLGADGETLRKIQPRFNRTAGVPVEEIYAIAQRVGADARLLATIGSWGDTLSPNKVLQDLKEWNEEERRIRGNQPPNFSKVDCTVPASGAVSELGNRNSQTYECEHPNCYCNA